MRIIRGLFRGRHFNLPKFFRDRPTTDLAKEALFNIIENNYYIDKLRVLDLFAGSGSISYEFASRACTDITSVDKNLRYVEFIRKTANELGVDINAVKADFFKYIRTPQAPYDIIFADPPFDMQRIDEIPFEVFTNKLLTPKGWLIIEHSKNLDFSKHLNFESHRKYGKVNFSFFAPLEKNIAE
ncbi:MAG: 16S rRNA (guanine(966)-N(2))-methyltransferase RsmD [Bacteroidia bacterium]|nr:MAG: 16S rRNA (guanine(966)-N(2))-methyltransferase RsmD [Bacteroidia bacterium]